MPRKWHPLFWIWFLLWASLLSAPASPSLASFKEASEEEKNALRALLPGEEEIPGLKARSGVEFYVPQNLFDYMNGQAEMYLDYGFRLLLTREYAARDGSPITVEIFRMAGPAEAFGIYAAERTMEDRDFQVGVEGFQGDNVLAFWKGPYYVKILCAKASPAAAALLQKTGAAAADKIRGDYSRPGLFSFFPEEFRVRRSERLIPRNFLGQPYLKNGCRVDYEKQGRGYQIFLLQEGSQEEIQKSFQRYQDFLRSQGDRITGLTQDPYPLVRAEGEKAKALFRYGTFWGGILDAWDFQEAEGIIQEMVGRIKAWKR
ncbi:MAG: DUF6599 family protein [Thermodesulfobacteriota bacterium]